MFARFYPSLQTTSYRVFCFVFYFLTLEYTSFSIIFGWYEYMSTVFLCVTDAKWNQRHTTLEYCIAIVFAVWCAYSCVRVCSSYVQPKQWLNAFLLYIFFVFGSFVFGSVQYLVFEKNEYIEKHLNKWMKKRDGNRSEQSIWVAIDISSTIGTNENNNNNNISKQPSSN